MSDTKDKAKKKSESIKRQFHKGETDLVVPEHLCIPRHILLNPEVNSTDKLVFSLLLANGAATEEGIKICNDSISKILQVTIQLAGHSIKRLASHGLVVTEIDSRLKRVRVPQSALQGG